MENHEKEELVYTAENWPYTDGNMTFERWCSEGAIFAKNGMPSKLDREERKFLESAEFLAWAGDYHTDNPNHVLLDKETAEPMLFYRGDGSRFRDYSIDYEKRNENIDNKSTWGVYFTNNRELALEYASSPESGLGNAFNSETDHPETYKKVVDYVKSLVKANPYFWADLYPYDTEESFVDEYVDKCEKEDYEIISNLAKRIKKRRDISLQDKIDVDATIDAVSKNYRLFSNLLRRINLQYFKSPRYKSIKNPLFYNASTSMSEAYKQFLQEPRVLKTAFLKGAVSYENTNPTLSKGDFGQEIKKKLDGGIDIVIGKNTIGGGLHDEYIALNEKSFIVVNTYNLAENQIKNSKQ